MCGLGTKRINDYIVTMLEKSRFIWLVSLTLVVPYSLACSGESAPPTLVVEGVDVDCEGATGHGDAPSDTDTHLDCNIEFLDCSDGSSYAVECVSELGTGTSECSCLIDGTQQSSFVADDECPVEIDAVISGCGWSD